MTRFQARKQASEATSPRKSRFPHKAVDSPAQGRADSQEVSPGRQLNPMSVEDHEAHAEKGQQRASDERPPDADPLQLVGESSLPYPAEQKSQDRRPEGCGPYQEGGIAGLGIHKSRILREEIQRTTRNAEKKEDPLILPSVPDFALLIGSERVDPNADVGQDKATEEDGRRIHPRADEDLGAHEGDAPDGDNRKGKKVEYGLPVHASGALTDRKDAL